MRRKTWPGGAAWLLGAGLLGLGCGGLEDREDGDVIQLGSENNYRATGSLSLPTVETAPGTDLDICWTNVTTDLQCHPVSPVADLDNVGLVRFLHLTQDQVQAKLLAGELKQSEVAGYVDFRTDHSVTCARLSQLSFFGTPLDVAAEYQESSDETYLLLLTQGTLPGVGARVMMFLKPTATSTNTRVDAPSGCGLLGFSADLTSLTPVVVPAAGPWTVDWRNVDTDGQGNPVSYPAIQKLLIGFYQGLTVPDLERQFFDIEILATSLWELPLSGGRTAELSRATERRTGAAFTGFGRTDGVWMLGLFCSTCQSPAPIVLTILAPEQGDP